MDLLGKVRGALQSGAGIGSSPAARSTGALLRHSNGLKELSGELGREEGLRILDLGQTSHANINFITNLGHKPYHEDLLVSCGDRKGYEIVTEEGVRFDGETFLKANLLYPNATFDTILLWDLADYLPEGLIPPLFLRLGALVKPGGRVLAYFHIRDGGQEAPFYRYNIRDGENIELRCGPSLPLVRIFNNRHIESLFQGFRSIKFFLARDNLREVLVTK